MNTQQFRTKTEFIARNNGNIPGYWVTGLDIGYSGVKLISPNKVACFPSYARRVDKDFQFAGNAPEDAILYKNLDTNDVWLVGAVAQNTISTGDTSDSESVLYGRDRYTNEMFKVICDVGMCISRLENDFGKADGRKHILQTGLPERYLRNDTDELRESLTGERNVAIKIGSGDWTEHHFNTNMEDIYVMSQPKGTLFSVCINKDGSFHVDAEKYLSSSVLVFDPGFGTLDLFPIKAGTVGKGETFPDLGMKRVLQETCDLILEKYNVDIPVPHMQKYLQNGTIRHMNKKTFESKEIPFIDLLMEANRKVCYEAIEKMNSVFNLIDYDYIIVTGGTGAAWLSNVQDKFRNLSTLRIINGNQNDKLPFIYSNVRGYYLYRYNQLGKELR